MSSASDVIGMFDSGVGGLTVARELVRALPGERVLYIADQAHVPYGGRSLEEVRGLALALTRHLFAQGAKVVVMACNISSATALDAARAELGDERVLGVIEPGAAAALALTERGRVGVLATEGTVRSGAYPRALERLSGRVQVTSVACPRFVPLVEAGEVDGPEAYDAAAEYLAPILRAGADTVILGCTHYPFLRETLRAVAGPDVRFVDPAQATVRALERSLVARGLRSHGATAPASVLLTTGALGVFEAQLPGIFHAPYSAGALDWSLIQGSSDGSPARR